MNCPTCSQPIENGAAFCGNCGQTLAQAPQPTPAPNPSQQPQPTPVAAVSPVTQPQQNPASNQIAQVYNNQAAAPPAAPVVGTPLAASSNTAIPAYAVPAAADHTETKLILSVVCGVLGIVGSLFMPILGLGLGLTSVILATLCAHTHKKGLYITGLVLGSLSILTALAVWVYVIKTNTQPVAQRSSTSSASGSRAVATPCYSFDFDSSYKVESSATSCDTTIYDGATLSESNDAYKVVSSSQTTINSSNLQDVAKNVLEADLKATLPSGSIVKSGSTTFAGSPAYSATIADAQGAITESIVLQKTATNKTFFVVLHAAGNSKDANLKALEANWEWK